MEAGELAGYVPWAPGGCGGPEFGVFLVNLVHVGLSPCFRGEPKDQQLTWVASPLENQRPPTESKLAQGNAQEAGDTSVGTRDRKTGTAGSGWPEALRPFPVCLAAARSGLFSSFGSFWSHWR